MSIKTKLETLNKNADSFANGKRLRCLILSTAEKVLFGNATVNFFLFRLHEKNYHERRKYLTERDKNRLEALNPADNAVLKDKEKFNAFFRNEIGRDYVYPAHSTLEAFTEFCRKHPVFLVKTNWTSQGSGIYKYELPENTDLKELFEKFSAEYNLLEEILQQHPKMAELNASSVNTVRIATLTHNKKVHIVSAALRIGAGGITDNLHGGGLGCSVDPATGIVQSQGYSDKGFEYLKHPLTGKTIPGFQIPNWDQVIALATSAAEKASQFTWIGWDVAVTENGAALIEGNHNQGIDLIQLGRKGLKPEIEAILKS